MACRVSSNWPDPVRTIQIIDLRGNTLRKTRLLTATALASFGLFATSSAFAQSNAPAAGQNNAGDRRDVQAPAGSTTSPEAAIEQNTALNPTPEQDQSGAGEVVVTGSRIRIANPNAQAVPVATITAAELLGTRGDVSLGDALNQLPQLRSTFSQANSTGSIGTAGLSLLDLRGLGTSRTLTLVNGRRVVTAVPGSYTPDVSTIPYDLVQSVDIVTGGNSAIYGSDAISGVVNFILRRDFDGFRLRAQGGVTSYGDRGTYLIGAIAGHNFLDGKVNLTVSGEYTHANPVFYADRSYLGAYRGVPGFITSQITNAPNRNFDGVPNASFVNGGIVFGNRSTGGTVVGACPAALTAGTAAALAANAAQRAAACTGFFGPVPVNTAGVPTGAPGIALANNFVFLPDGSILRDSPGTTGLVDNRTIGGGFLFGATATGVEDAMLLPGQDRYVANAMIHTDFSDAFKPFVEATYVRVKVTQQSNQPTFSGGTLTGSYRFDNPFLTPAARQQLTTILNPSATTTNFTLNRFNNDFGTRAEFHTRQTYRGVIGVEGDVSQTGNLHYEIAGNYGRTENFYRTGGNVLLANYNKAAAAVLAPAGYAGSNFVLNSQGQRVVCGVNADASTTNDDAACYPLNPFGRSAFDQRALNYVLYTSTRNQWAEEIDATAFLSGDSTGLFSLPGGPVGFAVGAEYRREDAFSGQDPITASNQTFLNPAATFDPRAVEIKEAFGELRVPLLANLPLLHELTVEGAGRVSDYGGTTGRVVAWNAGAIWAPFRSLRFRATYARSVRAPNLSNLYATAATTFVNGLIDPCNQANAIGGSTVSNITTNPNRVRNCAAAGVPTTITFTNPTTNEVLTNQPFSNISASGVAGINQGNPGLTPEIASSFTLGGVFTPEFLPGFSLKIDYYNIRVRNVISGLSGQQIIDRCYDDPTGIDNPFCAAVFRRTTTDPTTNATFNGQTTRTIQSVQVNPFPVAGNGIAFVNQPFNFAQLKTRGIDFDATYVKKFGDDYGINLRLLVSYVADRLSYSYITEPGRFDRFDSTLGDPKWQGQFTAAGHAGIFDISYNARYVGKQIVSGLGYETFFTNQGRGPTNPDARPFVFYDPIVYHSVRIGLNATDNFRFYFGVDNLSNELPPYDLTGTGSDAIYPNTGRMFYAGVEAKF